MFRRFGVSIWHDLFICVWLDCHNASTCDMTRSDLCPTIATMPFIRPRGRDSKRKSQLAEFSVCLIINSVILLHLLLRKDNALRPCPGPLYAFNGYVSTVRQLQFLVEKLQCVHVMATICLTNTHVTRSELVTCSVSFATGIQEWLSIRSGASGLPYMRTSCMHLCCKWVASYVATWQTKRQKCENENERAKERKRYVFNKNSTLKTPQANKQTNKQNYSQQKDKLCGFKIQKKKKKRKALVTPRPANRTYPSALHDT